MDTEKGRKQVEGLARVSRAMQEISRPSNFVEGIQVCLDELRKMGFNLHALAVHHVVDPDQHLVETCRVGLVGPISGFERRRGVGLVRCWRSGETQYEEDLERKGAEELALFQGKFKGIPVRSHLNIPFSRGVLSAHSIFPGAFSEQDVHLLQQMANLVAGGLRRVEELEQLRADSRALEENAARFRLLSEAAFEGLVITEKGRVVDANRQFAQMFGYTLAEVVGKTVLEFVAPTSRDLVRERVASGYEETYEHEALRKDGSRFPVEVQGKTHTRDSRTIRVTAVRDISKRKQAEQHLIHLERRRALGEVAGGVAHNFNNLLAVVLGYAELISLATRDTKIAGHVGHIVEAVSRAKQMVCRLNISVNRGHETRMVPVQVNRVIRETVAAFRLRWEEELGARGVAVRVVTELGEVPPVSGTPEELQDVLHSLLSNAVDAMPDGGSVTLRTRAAGEVVQLTVSDTGIGMDEETRRRIFDPFFSTKAHVGVGLGLSVTHGIITRWGGTIDAYSVPGEGASFQICLPIWTDPKDEPGRPDAVRPVRRGRILIVEDEALLKNLLATVLGKDHDVEALSDGREALERVSVGRYDVGLISLHIPGVPADLVAKKLKELDPATVAVGVTDGPLQTDDPRRSVFDLYLQKPFRAVAEFQSIIARALELRDHRTENPG